MSQLFYYIIVFTGIIQFGKCEKVSEECISEYEEYTNCLAQEFPSQFVDLEREYKGLYEKRMEQCFSLTKQGDKCIFTEKERSWDVFRAEYSPNCFECLLAGGFIEAKILKGGEEKTRCFNPTVLSNFRAEMEGCMAKKHGEEFRFPTVADYDAPSADTEHEEAALDTSRMVVLMGGKLMGCRTGREKRLKFPNTKKCIKQLNYPLNLHCSLNSACIKKQKPECWDSVLRIHNDMCSCGMKRRKFYLRKIPYLMAAIRRGLRSNGDKKKSCVDALVDAMKTKYVSWADELQKTVHCIDKNQSFDVKTYFNSGCRKILEEHKKTGGKGRRGRRRKNKALREVRDLMNFILAYVDSGLDRYARTCHCTTY